MEIEIVNDKNRTPLNNSMRDLLCKVVDGGRRSGNVLRLVMSVKEMVLLLHLRILIRILMLKMNLRGYHTISKVDPMGE